MEDKERKSLHENSALFVVISCVIGIFATALFIYLSKQSQHDLVIDLVGGIVVAVFALQISETWRHRTLSPKLAILERAVGYSRLFAIIEEIIDKYEVIEELKRKNSNCAHFFDEFSGCAFLNLQEELNSLSAGEINVHLESRELTTNRDFLLSLPRKIVRAVSFQDEGFWDEPEGRALIEAHRVALTNSVAIRRLFILKESTVEKQRSVITEQVEMRIDCRIVIQEKLKVDDLEDFVLYDDEYVRFARLVVDTGSNTLKHATLSSQLETVRKYIQKFEALELRSVRANEYFQQLDAQKRTQEPGKGGSL